MCVWYMVHLFETVIALGVKRLCAKYNKSLLHEVRGIAAVVVVVKLLRPPAVHN